MTCIVGIEHNGKVFIGGDSAAVGGYDIQTTRLRKVFKRGKFLIGYTTSFRMGQLLQYRLDVPGQTCEDDLEYLATTFIDAVRQTFIEGGFVTSENNQESGGCFLVGYNGRLYFVDADYQVNSYADGYFATGSGEDYATGSLFSTECLKPRKRIKMALEAAAKFSTTVCPPFVIEVL